MITQQETALISIAGEAMLIQSVLKIIDKKIVQAAKEGYTGLNDELLIRRKLDKRERKIVKEYYKKLGYYKVRIHARSFNIEWR